MSAGLIVSPLEFPTPLAMDHQNSNGQVVQTVGTESPDEQTLRHMLRTVWPKLVHTMSRPFKEACSKSADWEKAGLVACLDPMPRGQDGTASLSK